jgi:hypothetical protein
MKERLVGGEAFAVDASMIVADAHRRRGVAKIGDLNPTSSRAGRSGAAAAERRPKTRSQTGVEGPTGLGHQILA